MSLVAVYGGTGPQRYAFLESRFAPAFDQVVHLLDLDELEPREGETVLVPSRLHRGKLTAQGKTLLTALRGGADVLLFGQRPDPPLPGIRWEHRPTNFWWWLKPNGDSGVRVRDPDDPFFDHVDPAACEWHFHGVFDPPDGADVLVGARDGGAILYLDRTAYAGTLLVTTLDPVYHFGSRFMPATERFLEGLVSWVEEPGAGTRGPPTGSRGE